MRERRKKSQKPCSRCENVYRPKGWLIGGRHSRATDTIWPPSRLLRKLPDEQITELRPRQEIVSLQGDIARLLARALIIVHKLAVQGHLDARTVGFDDVLVPDPDGHQSRCGRCL